MRYVREPDATTVEPKATTQIRSFGGVTQMRRWMVLGGSVKLIRTSIRLLARPKSMRPIIDATQREQRHGLAWN